MTGNAFDIDNRWIACFSRGSAFSKAATGVVTNFKPPRIMREYESDRRTGELGAIPRFQGYKELAGSFDFKGFNSSFQIQLLTNDWLQISLKSVGLNYNGDKSVNIVRLNAMIVDVPVFPDLDATSTTNTVSYVAKTVKWSEQNAGGDIEEKFFYDPAEYFYNINGVNQMEDLLTFLTCI